MNLAGYRMPAEWEPHDATWLAWPCNEETFPRGLEPVRKIWIEMAATLCPHETVHILVNTPAARADVLSRLLNVPSAERIQVHVVPNNDVWMRDAGPIFVTTAEPGAPKIVAHDFVFNTWGRKYGPWDLDDVIPVSAARIVGCPVESHEMVLEGGSIDVNGRGTLLTTRQCLLNKNRNPEMSQELIEARLAQSFGVRKILWLDEGIAGDDTDGHIDDIARFVDPTTIVAVAEDDPKDENNAILRKNLADLRGMTDQDNRPIRIVELPMPDPVDGPFGRSPASYGNFYIANNVVLVPIFSCSKDALALDILQSVFPNRRVVGIECTALVHGLGAIHCVTQQQPAV